jgi:SAM-dependent methyltransferase
MDHLPNTRASWNVATRTHNAHKLDQAAFLRTGSTLFDDERALAGEVRGLRMLHVLCNSGQDTLSWAKLGAAVTGVDLSDEAIAFATTLSADTGIGAQFVRQEIVDFVSTTDQRFDLVFGSYGCLPWIEPLGAFFAGVQRVLRPGGRAVFLEFHPLVWSFDDAFRFTADDYFATAPFLAPVGDYVGAADGALSPSGHQPFDGPANPHAAAAWQHTVADLVTAVAQAGLRVERLVEYPYANGCKVCPGLVRDGRRFVAPPGVRPPPLMLGLVASSSTDPSTPRAWDGRRP